MIMGLGIYPNDYLGIGWLILSTAKDAEAHCALERQSGARQKRWNGSSEPCFM